MSNLSRVFFPLRTNAGWFESPTLTTTIETQIKQAILLYDEIVIEDGTYVANVGPTGKFELQLPPGSISEDERTHSYQSREAGGTIGVSLGNDTAISFGQCVRSVHIDYYKILLDIKPNRAPFITTVALDDRGFDAGLRRTWEEQTTTDRRLLEGIVDEHFLRDLIAKNLNRDLLMSILLEAPLFIDSEHQDLLLRKSAAFNKQTNFTSVPEEAVLRHLFTVACPDFSQLSFDAVLQLREEATWSDFRAFVREVTAEVIRDPEHAQSDLHFRELVYKRTVGSLLTELQKPTHSGLNLGIDLALGAIGLVPHPVLAIGAAVAGALKSGVTYFRDGSGWMVFLSKVSRCK